jgi:hypothetical protein
MRVERLMVCAAGAGVDVAVGVVVGEGVGVDVAVAVEVGEGVGVGGVVPVSIIRTQSFSPTLLFPDGLNTRVPVLGSAVPISMYAALVGSNQRACDEPPIAPISTVIDPLWSGGM